MKYFKKDEEFLKSRRLFIRNTGLILAAAGFAPEVRIQMLDRLVAKVGFNSAYAIEPGVQPAKVVIEVVWRSGCNMRKFVAPKASLSETRPDNSHVWSGNREPGAPAIAAATLPQLSSTTRNYLASGVVFDNLKDVPLAYLEVNRGQNGHTNNHAVRNGVANKNNDVENGLPCLSVLHAATTPRNAILPGVVRWNLNGADVQDNVATTALTSKGFSAPGFVDVNGGNNTQNMANQFRAIFNPNINLAAYNTEQKAVLAATIDEFTQYRVPRLGASNLNQVGAATGSLARLLTLNVGQLLTLTTEELQEWDAAVNTNAGQAQYNLGLAMGSIYKAVQLGLAQDFILKVDEADRHSESEGYLQNQTNNPDGGWQHFDRLQAENFARVMGTFFRKGSQDNSAFGTGKKIFEETLIMTTSEWNRTNTAVGATDGGNGGVIMIGGNVNPGTYFDHSADFSSTLYPSDPNITDPLAAGALVNDPNLRPTGPQMWRMIARAGVGDSLAARFDAPDQKASNGSLYTFALKQR